MNAIVCTCPPYGEATWCAVHGKVHGEAPLEGNDVAFLLDGLSVASLAELKRLVDLGREHDGTALHGEALLGVPLS